jgi:hypothetical protein
MLSPASRTSTRTRRADSYQSSKGGGYRIILNSLKVLGR